MTDKPQSDSQHRASDPPARGWPGAWERLGGELAAALGFLTRLPVPGAAAAHTRPLAEAGWAFPIAGLAVGLIAGAALALALALGVPALAAALLALATGAMLTGALHEDGLADCCDGFWGGDGPERRLAIMRDSRVGGFGALGLVIATGLKAAALAAVADAAGGEAAWLALIAAHMVGRGALMPVMHLLPRAGRTGLAAMAGRPDGARTAVAAALGALAVPMLIGPSAGAAAVLVAAVATAATAWLARRKLGGYNGDALGLIEQAVEIAVLLTAAAAVAQA